MRCPVDRHPLKPQPTGTGSFAICEECAGVWLTRKALEAPSLDPASLPDKSRRPNTTLRRRRKVLVCPECAHPLESERVEGVEIERCVYCKGIWLDAGEYDAVRRSIEVRAPGVTESRSNPALDIIGAGMELSMEAIEAVAKLLFLGHL